MKLFLGAAGVLCLLPLVLGLMLNAAASAAVASDLGLWDMTEVRRQRKPPEIFLPPSFCQVSEFWQKVGARTFLAAEAEMRLPGQGDPIIAASS